MNNSFLTILLATTAIVIAACARPVPTAPWIEVSESNAVAYDYTLGRLEVSGKDLCVFDPSGALFVFSEAVTPLPTNHGIHATNIDVKVGETFQGGAPVELHDGYECGGKRYPAIHIQGKILFAPSQ